MSNYDDKKVISAVVHTNLFIASSQLGPTLNTSGGERACRLELSGNFLKVTFKGKSKLVPLANVREIELAPGE